MSASFPYPGLRPFRGDETDIFFGREEQTDQLLEKLGHSRFLAVVGPSGCGKSSLVRAGMIAGLDTGFMAGAGARWRVAVMRPGSRPLRRLAGSLLTESALGPERGGDHLPYLRRSGCPDEGSGQPGRRRHLGSRDPVSRRVCRRPIR